MSKDPVDHKYEMRCFAQRQARAMEKLAESFAEMAEAMKKWGPTLARANEALESMKKKED